MVGKHRVPLVVRDMPDAHACWDYDHKTIFISPTTLDDIDFFRETLRHEMRHAAFDFSGLAWMMPDKLNEAICRCLDGVSDPAWEAADDRLWRWRARRNKSRKLR
jgi:hypothetical protein